MPQEDLAFAHALAVTHGANEADAAVFAEHYLKELAGFRAVADEIEPSNPEECALEFSLEFLTKYQQQRAAGHSELWAKAYAASIEEPHWAREEAYEALGVNERGDEQGAVYREAYTARIHQGDTPEYAAAYAKWVTDVDALSVEKYFEAYAEVRENGHSAVYAHEYAAAVCDDAPRRAAAMTAEFYEQALTDGLPDLYADMYAEELSQALYARGVDAAGRIFHTLRVEGYVKGHQYATDNRLLDVKAFAESTSNEYLNQVAGGEEEELPPTAIRESALQLALQTVAGRWGSRR